MKRYLWCLPFLAFAAIVLLLAAAPPAPIQRNQFTTNVPGAVVLGPVAFDGAVNINGASTYGGLASFTNNVILGPVPTNAAWLNIARPTIGLPFYQIFQSIGTNTNSAPWSFFGTSSPNASDIRKNDIWTWGYNAHPSGRMNTNENRFSWNLETYYENSGARYIEHYINYVSADGTKNYRPWGITIRTNFSQTDFITDLINCNSPTGSNDSWFRLVDDAPNKAGNMFFNGAIVINTNGANIGSITMAGGNIDVMNSGKTTGGRLRMMGTTDFTLSSLASGVNLDLTGFPTVKVETNLSVSGNISLPTGSNQRAGNLTLIGGTKTVANTSVTANTLVLLTRKTSGGTVGTAITYTLSAGTSFTVTSDNVLDTSTFTYMLIENP